MGLQVEVIRSSVISTVRISAVSLGVLVTVSVISVSFFFASRIYTFSAKQRSLLALKEGLMLSDKAMFLSL